MAKQQSIAFDRRFFDRYAGSIVTDGAVALVELVANAWDAFATDVTIEWPRADDSRHFIIRDNGIGMTSAEFESRWSTLDYDRASSQGQSVKPPAELTGRSPRLVYGRNGKGRHAAFYYGDPYILRTWRDGQEVTYRVERGNDHPFRWTKLNSRKVAEGHGTEIQSTSSHNFFMSAENAREVIGTKYLTDPDFKVSVDGVPVTFADIPSNLLKTDEVSIPGYGIVKIFMIDGSSADRTTRRHGIAWHVGKRLVGECKWRGSDFEKILDGRTSEAKRFTFIVAANFLEDAVTDDWTGFKPDNLAWQTTRPVVQDRIRNLIAKFNYDRRAESRTIIKERFDNTVSQLAPLSKNRWNSFVDTVVDSCPNLGINEIAQVASILANLEQSDSKYSILQKFGKLIPGDFDDLNRILTDWTVKVAKIALDEIQTRLSLITQLDLKLRDNLSDELKDLQPLFENSLWVFGPEFETIEFTSNLGMTSVVRKLFGRPGDTSLNRPDFIIVPDGTLGLYSRDNYGLDHEVNGVASLVVVEIKKPGVTIGADQKSQAWKYAKELLSIGMIDDLTKVHCFVLGSKKDPRENIRVEGNVIIEPMTYDIFIKRAEARMLNLRRKLKDAPFLQDKGLDEVLPSEVKQTSLDI